MANPEHFDLLKQGIATWNAWRDDNRTVRIDLDEVILSGGDLGFEGRSAGAAIFADFYDVSFRGSDLSNCDLSYANLSRADLTGSNLRNARLRAATLIDTNFSRADLSGTDFREAKLLGTILADVDLTGARNLDSCIHRGPSTIDYQTLAKSGQLPLKFLRGCGLPDTLIDYLPSLLDQPIQFYSCFISYSIRDQEFADRLHVDLQGNGVRCWFAPEDLKIGDPFRQRIDEAIRLHDKLLLILSDHSVRSDWVREEVESGLERERREGRTVLFPVRLDDAVMDTSVAWAASIRRQRHVGDFSRWKQHDTYSKALKRLLRDLQSESYKVRDAHSEEPSPN